MSEEWRTKRYYKPRVLISTERILTSQFDDALICVTGAQLEMLRNLTQYLHRRSSFVSEYGATTYKAPSNDEWDIIEGIVADLELTLMGCEEMLAELRAISRAIRGITGPSSTTPALIETFVDSGELQYDDDYGGDTIVGDAKQCAVAQLTWSFAYEMLTEVFQPIQDKASDVMMPIAMVAIASWIGTPVIGIPVGLILAAIWAFIESWEEGQLANVINGLVSAKDELVCAVFTGLQVDQQTAYLAAAAIIETLPAWSPIDISLGKTLFSPFVMNQVEKAYDNTTTWAVNNVEAGFCDDCLPYIVGSDWYAKVVLPSAGTIDFDHVPPAGWEPGCYDFDIQVGEEFCGVVFDVVDEVGDCELIQQNVGGGDCEGDTNAWENRSEVLPADSYFAVNGDDIDEVACKAVLAPGATDLADTLAQDGPAEMGAGWHFGWSCTGSITVVVKYIVFVGSPPA